MAGGDSTVRNEEMNFGKGMPDQDLYLLPVSVVHISFHVQGILTGPAYSRIIGF